MPHLMIQTLNNRLYRLLCVRTDEEFIYFFDFSNFVQLTCDIVVDIVECPAGSESDLGDRLTLFARR